MLNTILNAMRVSRPVTETVNRSDDQHTVSIEIGNADNTHRLPSANRRHASGFIRSFLKVSEWVKGLLSPINQQTALTPSKIMADVKQYFNNSIAVSSDVSEQLINDLLTADGISASAALDTLTSVSESYFTCPDAIISDEITKVLMEAFLRLKDKDSSEALKKSVGEVLWGIYLDMNDSDSLSLSTQQIMIDANLVFDQWHEKSDIFGLIELAENYCSVNRPDPEKLAVLMKAIDDKPVDDPDDKFDGVFTGVAGEYFTYNASDASVARLLIDAIARLFDGACAYDKYSYFCGDNVVYCDLPDEIAFPDALKCYINWFFYDDYSPQEIKHYSLKAFNEQKNVGVLSELIGALWGKAGADYNVVELARLVYQNNNDVRRQLCIVESLVLLEEQKGRVLPVSVNLPSLIDGVIDFYLVQIKDEPEKIKNLLSLVCTAQYSDRCRESVVKKINVLQENINGSQGLRDNISERSSPVSSEKMTAEQRQQYFEEIEKLEQQLNELLSILEPEFNDSAIEEIDIYIEAGEYGLAFETLVAVVHKRSIKVSQEVSLLMESTGKMMEMDVETIKKDITRRMSGSGH